MIQMRPKKNQQKRLLIRKKKRPKMKMQRPKMKMLRPKMKMLRPNLLPLLRPNLLPLQFGYSSISRIGSAIQDPRQVTKGSIMMNLGVCTA